MLGCRLFDSTLRCWDHSMRSTISQEKRHLRLLYYLLLWDDLEPAFKVTGAYHGTLASQSRLLLRWNVWKPVTISWTYSVVKDDPWVGRLLALKLRLFHKLLIIAFLALIAHRFDTGAGSTILGLIYKHATLMVRAMLLDSWCLLLSHDWGLTQVVHCLQVMWLYGRG